MDKISVIVPIYNQEKYLKECIDSILNQDYGDFEVLLVNDGSTDNSLNICYEYSKNNDNIKVLNLEHGGVSNARNKGIKSASGKYVCFIDSDDIINKKFLSTLYMMISKYDSDIAEVDFRYITQEDIDKKEKIEVYSQEEMIDRLYSKNGVRTVHISNKLFNIKLFENIEFENRENEDEYIICKLFFATNKKIVINSKKLYIYRTMESGRNRKFNTQKLNILNVFDEREKYFLNNEKLVEKNKIAKLDMILYLSYICKINNKIKEKNMLYDKFKIEYKKSDVSPDIRRKMKYYLFIKNPSLILWIIELRNKNKYK